MANHAGHFSFASKFPIANKLLRAFINIFVCLYRKDATVMFEMMSRCLVLKMAHQAAFSSLVGKVPMLVSFSLL